MTNHVSRFTSYEEVSMTERDEASNRFEPEITVFTCIYCAYMAVDTAGALRIKYPASIKLVKLPCTGKVDMRYLLEAFEQGADGVCIVGCPIGNCHHYILDFRPIQIELFLHT